MVYFYLLIFCIFVFFRKFTLIALATSYFLIMSSYFIFKKYKTFNDMEFIKNIEEINGGGNFDRITLYKKCLDEQVIYRNSRFGYANIVYILVFISACSLNKDSQMSYLMPLMAIIAFFILRMRHNNHFQDDLYRLLRERGAEYQCPKCKEYFSYKTSRYIGGSSSKCVCCGAESETRTAPLGRDLNNRKSDLNKSSIKFHNKVGYCQGIGVNPNYRSTHYLYKCGNCGHAGCDSSSCQNRSFDGARCRICGYRSNLSR